MPTHTLDVGEQIVIGGVVRLTVLAAADGQAVLGIDTPAGGEADEDPPRRALVQAALTLPPGRN